MIDLIYFREAEKASLKKLNYALSKTAAAIVFTEGILYEVIKDDSTSRQMYFHIVRLRPVGRAAGIRVRRRKRPAGTNR